MRTIRFTVLGKPSPSAVRPVPIKRGGEVIGSRLAPGRDAAHAKRIESWKGQVAAAASGLVGADLLAGPLEVEYLFVSPRPRGQFGTGKNSGKVKPSSPAYPITRPDALKITRVTEDALTGVLWRDDSQVVDLHVRKRYGSPERCEVVVRELVNELEAAA